MNSLDPDRKRRESLRICRLIESVLPKSGPVLAFEPLSDEPDISPIIERLRREGRLILVAGDRSDPHLDPAGAVPALALVPGRAFDIKGHRIGRGGGTFDRILARLECPKIGVAFDEQIFLSLPTAAHDVPMDRILHPSVTYVL